MDFTFLSVTLILIFFLFVSYYLKVLKLSSPLILIYLIFCFTYIIDSDKYKDSSIKSSSENVKVDSKIVEIPIVKPKKNNNANNRKTDISKPIVSFNPKPIIIDTNLIVKRDKEKIVLNNTDLGEKTPNVVNEDKDKSSELMILKEIMICRGVYKRNPIKPGFDFANNVDSLFCYTKISNKGSKQEIKHLWYYENKLVTSVTYNIKTSYNYRSWSKKTIPPTQTGQWRVDVIDNKQRILGSRKFNISSLNNAF